MLDVQDLSKLIKIIGTITKKKYLLVHPSPINLFLIMEEAVFNDSFNKTLNNKNPFSEGRLEYHELSYDFDIDWMDEFLSLAAVEIPFDSLVNESSMHT
jgi:hypothetical protein